MNDYLDNEGNPLELLHRPVVSVNFDISPYMQQELARLSKATKKSKVHHFRKALAEYLAKKKNQYDIHLYLKESIEKDVAVKEKTDTQIE
jgi:predicted DNA-binding protein